MNERNTFVEPWREVGQHVGVPTPSPSIPQPTTIDYTPFAAQEGAKETTSGVDRSQALVIRFAPVERHLLLLAGGVFILIAIALIKVGEYDAILSFVGCACGTAIVFACLSLRFFRKMDAQERYDSRHGVEHHRIQAAKELAEMQQKLDQENKRAITQAWIRYLEGPRVPH